jgi:hypothetical protein
MPWLRWLDAGFSLQRLGLNTWWFHVSAMGNEVALEQVSVPLSSVFPCQPSPWHCSMLFVHRPLRWGIALARSTSAHPPVCRSFQFLEVGWDWFHLLRRPFFGLLYQPRTIGVESGPVSGMRIGNWPNATLPTTNPTWPDLDSNPSRRGGKPATKRLTYDMFFSCL